MFTVPQRAQGRGLLGVVCCVKFACVLRALNRIAFSRTVVAYANQNGAREIQNDVFYKIECIYVFVTHISDNFVLKECI